MPVGNKNFLDRLYKLKAGRSAQMSNGVYLSGHHSSLEETTISVYECINASTDLHQHIF